MEITKLSEKFIKDIKAWILVGAIVLPIGVIIDMNVNSNSNESIETIPEDKLDIEIKTK